MVTSHYLQFPVLECIGFPNIQVDRNLILQGKRQWYCQWNYTMSSFHLISSLFPSTALIPGTLSKVFHPARPDWLAAGAAFCVGHKGKTDLEFGNWRNFRVCLLIFEYLVSSEQKLKFISLLSVSCWVINKISLGNRDRENEGKRKINLCCWSSAPKSDNWDSLLSFPRGVLPASLQGHMSNWVLQWTLV